MSSGYRETASGLVVPETTPRTRRVATKAEWRAYESAIATYKRLGIQVQMRCEHACGPIVPKLENDGGANLQCDCTDRIFSNSF